MVTLSQITHTGGRTSEDAAGTSGHGIDDRKRFDGPSVLRISYNWVM